MTQTAIPAEAADWARGHVGRHAAWTLPADLSGTRTWRMSSPQGLIDIRVSRTDEDFGREVYAHRKAIRRLSPGHGPRLLASEPRLRSLLTVQPRSLRVDSADLQFLPRIHENAGHLLRLLHDSAGLVREARAQATQTTVLYVQRVRATADRFATVLPPGQADAVQRSASLVLELVHELPAAFCHGTFGPTNWEWQSRSQTLSFTGFGRSQVMAAVIDIARPALLWAKQPNLRDWFLRGYERALTEPELLVLGDLAVLASSEDLLHAIRQRDTESVSVAALALSQAIDHNETLLESSDTSRVDVHERPL